MDNRIFKNLPLQNAIFENFENPRIFLYNPRIFVSALQNKCLQMK